MLRRQRLEETDNQERWLVSYSDFMTLLFAFFVVMYAISSVNEGKYRVLSESLAAVFNHEPKSLQPVEVGKPSTRPQSSPVPLEAPPQHEDPDPGSTELDNVAEEITSKFAGLVPDDYFDVNDYENWIEVNLSSDLLFAAGQARFGAQAADVLDRLAEIFNRIDNPITVEGYTDASRVTGTRYPSNWELSTARATSVVRALIDRDVDRRRLAAVGYGDNHPVATNATVQGRSQNRRVTLIVARNDGVQRNLAAVSSARRAPVTMRWRTEAEASKPADETSNAETLAGGDDVVNAVRKANGGVIFTSEPESP